MATEAIPRPAVPRQLRIERLPTVGLIAFIGGLGYLTLWPLVRLQYLALKNGAQAYNDAYTRPGWWTTVKWTIELGLGSLVIALIVGTGLAWAANSLPPKLSVLRVIPILPIVVPAVASVLGWAFLLSPHPGYLNQLLRLLPWWHGDFEGPGDIYTLPWIIIITGLGARVVHLPLRQLGAREHQRRVDRGGAGQWLVANGGLLPRYPAAPAPVARVRRRASRSCSASGSSPRPCSSAEPEHQRPDDRHVHGDAADPAGLRARRRDRVAAARLRHPRPVHNRVLLGDHTRFVTHGGKGGFRKISPGSKLAAFWIVLYGLLSTVLPLLALVFVSLSRFWSGDVHPSRMTLGTWRTVTTASGVMPAIWNSIYLSLVAVAITLPVGFIAATLLHRRHEHRIARPMLDFIVAMPLSIPAVIFGVGFLLAYTTSRSSSTARVGYWSSSMSR